MVQHISLPVVVALLLCKTDCLSPSVMKKGVCSHFLFLFLRRHWEVKAPSPPALLMMTKWSAPTRRRLPSTWLVAKLTNLVSVFKLKSGVEKKNVSWLLFIYLFIFCCRSLTHLVQWKCPVWLQSVPSNRPCCPQRSATSWTTGWTAPFLFGKVKAASQAPEHSAVVIPLNQITSLRAKSSSHYVYLCSFI